MAGGRLPCPIAESACRLQLAVGEWHARPSDQPLSSQEMLARFPELHDLPPHLVNFPENAGTLLMIDWVCDRLEELYRSQTARPRLEFCLANLPMSCRQIGFCSLLTAHWNVCRAGQNRCTVSHGWFNTLRIGNKLCGYSPNSYLEMRVCRQVFVEPLSFSEITKTVVICL